MTPWMSQWPTAYTRGDGSWTVRRGDQWGLLDPETAQVEPLDPSADPRLPGMASALTAGHLVGYRHGRRAIVETPDGFIKVVRPNRVDALVARHAVLAANPFLVVPAVMRANADGRVELTRIRGRSLHLHLRNDPLRGLDDISELIAALHAQPPPRQLPARCSENPRSWIATSERSPTPHLPWIRRIAEELPTLDNRADIVVHGDLHDKNIFCDIALGDRVEALALIDLDGLGLGAAEDDLANLAVHLELRNLQGRTGLVIGARSAALYGAYQRVRPLDPERLRAVERHTWFRLACLYQYRAASACLVPALLRFAGEQPR